MPEQSHPEGQKDVPSAENPPADDEMSLLNMLIVLAKHKKVVLGFPLGAAVVAVIVSLILPKWYEATSRILPPQQQQSTTAAMLSQLGGLASLAGAAGLGLKNPSDLYVGLLKSRTVADALIQRFDLLKLYDEDYPTEARKELDRHTTIRTGKEGIIAIEVEDKDPKRAAAMANAYVEELNKLTQTVAVSEAGQRRVFFERQLLQAKDNLTAAEIAARQGLEKGGLAQVDAQGRSLIEVMARLRAQISAKEVQIGAMRAFAAEGNPELQRTQQELESARRELARIEGSSPVAAAGKAGQSDSGGLDNLGRLRQVKYYEYLYEFMAKQYEIAKIDEAKEGTLVQVVDKAIEPDRKSRPRRSFIVLLTALGALFVSIVWVSILEALTKLKADPMRAGRLEILKGYSRWRQPI